MNYLLGLCFFAALASNQNHVQGASCSCNCNDGSSWCPGNKYCLPVATVPKRLVKQCVFSDMNDGKDSGALSATCKFTKQESDSSLRVTFNGNMRMVGCSGGCCRRWFLTINGKLNDLHFYSGNDDFVAFFVGTRYHMSQSYGQECKDPTTIDTQIYADGTANRHSPGTLDGFRNNIPKGEVTVGISVALCRSGKPGDAFTGWESVSRIVVEEMVTL